MPFTSALCWRGCNTDEHFSIFNRTSQSYYHHFQNNTFGPLLAAKYLLLIPSVQISNIAFISDSCGSASAQSFIWGLAAYSASKAALNMGLRVCYLSIYWAVSSRLTINDHVYSSHAFFLIASSRRNTQRTRLRSSGYIGSPYSWNRRWLGT